ncbi:MFS transporter [Variovorax sp. YR216]|uniref:MFS transporter n=1 Tax=Variovorax sp. YR216 TaxID=1882828 RepID=UPI0008979F22|nr:MFS transporter [Variovorax sp. YR216]SEA79933.1 Major Facilitator Superfamily protein [Variovorax sp. YR216]
MAAAANPPLAQKLPLYALIAALPFSDFLQTGIVAFNAAPVMGDIGAGPEEYSLVATLYAMVAIGVLSMHRWVVERLGWRRTLLAASALFAVGALACASSGNLLQFAAGRLVMALGCASFMTAGRVLVSRIPPSPRRFTGVKFFASGVAWGIVAGPIAASAALATAGWRAAFAGLLLPAALLAALAAWTLDDALPVPEATSQPHPTGLLALMGGSFLLLHALQRSGFDFFTDAGTLGLLAALALPALALFVRTDRRRARPLIRFGELAQTRYLVGLAMFGLCYLVLGANNLMLPVLLQRALGLPLETIGRYLGIGALAGVASWIVLSRLLPHSPGPTRYYLVGFGALLLCAWQLSRLSETANPLHSVVPALLFNGAFVIVVLSTTAMQTFQTLQRDDTTFSHANQVKNMLAQFGIAAGTALATLCMQWRSSVRFTRLSESLSPSNPAVGQTLDQLTRHFAATHGPAEAPQIAIAQLGLQAAQEATFMAALDYFFVVMLVAIACLALVLGERALRGAPALRRRATFSPRGGRP